MVYTLKSVSKGLNLFRFLQLILLVACYTRFEVPDRSDDLIHGAPTSPKLMAVPERHFPDERVTNFTNDYHTHYMDPWGFDVRNHYESNFEISCLVPQSITLASQISLDDIREQRLLDLASRWSGCLSITLYFVHDTHSTIEEAMQVIDRLRTKHYLALRNTHFHIVFNTGRDIQYPYNYLRNVALNIAMTDFVMLLDADLIPSPNAHDTLMKKFRSVPELRNHDKVLLILPAFERRLMEGEMDLSPSARDLPTTKPALLKQMKDHPDTFKIFQENEFEPAHLPTNFSRWYNSNMVYRVKYYFRFEPYYVIRKIPALPPLWEHFTGFGKDKASWVEEIAAAGFQLYVSPDEFLVHIQHDYKKQLVKERKVRREILREFRRKFRPYIKALHGTNMYETTEEYPRRRPK